MMNCFNIFNDTSGSALNRSRYGIACGEEKEKYAK
jgi:hypothetical protein|tara:strand:- start:215 stop:319 length:105 start_codon:yes stop_codon:yes gene_type:complete